MKTKMRLLAGLLVVGLAEGLLAQDGDLLTSSPGGRGYFETVPLISGGGVVAPFNLNVATSPFSLATLNVRGDQLPVNSFWPAFGGGASVCTFRTDVGDDTNQNWDMVRGADHIGRIWHYGNQSAFNVQAMKGPLRLRNKDMDGIRINGNNSSGTVNGFTVNLVGFAALGVGAQMDALSTNAPWARLHLVHENLGTSPDGGFRPWMRNGMLGTGNSDLYYIGHKYAMTGGTGAEQDDNCDVVAAWFDNVLPAGVTQAYNNYSFRYRDPGQTQAGIFNYMWPPLPWLPAST